MSVLPGVEVRVSAQAIPSGAPTDTGRLFAVGITERGPTTPTVVSGLGGFRRLFGGPTSYDTLSTPLAAFFAASEGAGDVVVARVVGPAAAPSEKTVSDGTDDTITFKAAWPGAAGDDITVIVAADGDGFQLTVEYDGDVVERWRGLEDVDDAVQTLQASEWIRAENEAAGSGNPSNGSYDLENGDDDRSNIVDATWESTLAGIPADLGPGQVVAPGRTSSTGRGQLVAHAEATNRIAFLDAAEGDAKAELNAAAGDSGSRQAALFAPWLHLRLDGRIRTVPASVVAAGICARIDADAPTAHTGPDITRAALPGRFVDVDVDFGDADAGELNGNGVNLFRSVRGQVLLRGFRTVSDAPEFEQLSQARYIMSVSSRLASISDLYVFRALTPQVIGDYGSDLAAELLGDFQAGALFGDAPDDAFGVDVSPDVNPPQQLEQGVLRARVSVTPAPLAERIVIDLIKTRIG